MPTDPDPDPGSPSPSSDKAASLSPMEELHALQERTWTSFPDLWKDLQDAAREAGFGVAKERKAQRQEEIQGLRQQLAGVTDILTSFTQGQSTQQQLPPPTQYQLPPQPSFYQQLPPFHQMPPPSQFARGMSTQLPYGSRSQFSMAPSYESYPQIPQQAAQEVAQEAPPQGWTAEEWQRLQQQGGGYGRA